MKTYLYPQNLRASANLWLWSMRDFAVLVLAALLTVLILVNTGFMLPVLAVLIYAFMTIRLEDVTVMDFLLCAVRFFISAQQYFEWQQNETSARPGVTLPKLLLPFFSNRRKEQSA